MGGAHVGPHCGKSGTNNELKHLHKTVHSVGEPTRPLIPLASACAARRAEHASFNHVIVLSCYRVYFEAVSARYVLAISG